MTYRARAIARRGAGRRRITRQTIKAWKRAFGPAIRERIAKQGEQIYARSGAGWSGRMTCDACPVQIEGTIGGHPFYFRSRWDEWTLDVAPIGGDPVMGAVVYSVNGIGDSWMPHTEAWETVEEHAKRFLAGERRPPSGDDGVEVSP